MGKNTILLGGGAIYVPKVPDTNVGITFQSRAPAPNQTRYYCPSTLQVRAETTLYNRVGSRWPLILTVWLHYIPVPRYTLEA